MVSARVSVDAAAHEPPRAPLCCPVSLEGTYYAQPCGGDGGLLQGAGVGDWGCIQGSGVVSCAACQLGDACGGGGLFGYPSTTTECRL